MEDEESRRRTTSFVDPAAQAAAEQDKDFDPLAGAMHGMNVSGTCAYRWPFLPSCGSDRLMKNYFSASPPPFSLVVLPLSPLPLCVTRPAAASVLCL